MLTRTATRRAAAVLMVALVAMLLVATGGSARAAQARTSVGSGHSIAAPHAGRHVTAVSAAPHDQAPLHLDLASTPPASDSTPVGRIGQHVEPYNSSHLARDLVTAVGRGPPAP